MAFLHTGPLLAARALSGITRSQTAAISRYGLPAAAACFLCGRTLIHSMPSYPSLLKIIFNIIPLRQYVPRGLLRFPHQNLYTFLCSPVYALCPLPLDLISLIMFDVNLTTNATGCYRKTCNNLWHLVSVFMADPIVFILLTLN